MGKRDETGEYFVANLAYEVSGTKSKGTKLNPIVHLYIERGDVHDGSKR